ncbi:uncharacterized protein LOC111367792 [Olea europaea var. sylvestris]|uniref:uncharacterized protein LOC111367792 n=1 Tax=Olea europaea var. sylvestris TaxID=158386 RepID=UPI000C1D706C|nr:uncharacterized protein LOC111367792 [Olea europaea var. sylvestris]
MTPFEALYGIKPPQLSLDLYQQSNVAAVEELLQHRYQLNQQLKENLAQAGAKMKLYADTKRSERSFNEGEWVFGPYQITKKIGTVAYKLALPASSRIHPVFHVSLFKKKLGDRAMPVLQLPDENRSKLPTYHPLSILQSRTITRKKITPPSSGLFIGQILL